MTTTATARDVGRYLDRLEKREGTPRTPFSGAKHHGIT